MDRHSASAETAAAPASPAPTGIFIEDEPRAQFVNLTSIEKVEPWFSGSVKVRLRGGPEVEFSRRQAQLFRDRTSL